MLIGLMYITPSYAQTTNELNSTWYEKAPNGDIKVKLYFFWSNTCPHCHHAKPFIEKITKENDWLLLKSYELSNPANVGMYNMMARSLNQQANGVPAFIYCDKMELGYDDDANVGAALFKSLKSCHDKINNKAALAPTNDVKKNTSDDTGKSAVTGTNESATPADNSVESEEPEAKLVGIPFVGKVDVNKLSLPLLTIVLAGFDAFNPCAFFVLLFLLSIMVKAKSRVRMLTVGSVFVFFSALVYFLSMSALLNLILIINNIVIITLVAGVLGIIIGALAVKDYFAFGKGPSLSIPEGVKPGMFKKMNKLVEAESFVAMLIGAGFLAVLTNLYELLCTSGFPTVYIGSLVQHNLDKVSYYSYLAFYNLVYVLPLIIIVGIFTITLGSRKLSEKEGRLLKLISGLMMLELGLILVVYPILLNSLLVSVFLLLSVIQQQKSVSKQ